MEVLDQVKKAAEENLTLAEDEKELSKKVRMLAKSESRRAKARRDFTKKELDLIKIRLEVAETNKSLVDKKLNIRKGGILRFNEEKLRYDVQTSIFLGNLAKAQERIVEVYNQIADLEEEIARNKGILADLILNNAKIRVNLSKKQKAYVKGMNNQIEIEKISKIEKEIETLHNNLYEESNKVSKQDYEVRVKENGLADLNSIACSKLSEREKIRHT